MTSEYMIALMAKDGGWVATACDPEAFVCSAEGRTPQAALLKIGSLIATDRNDEAVRDGALGRLFRGS